MGRYCIYCGREATPDNPVVGNVCLECRIKRGELIIRTRSDLKYDLCKVCGNVKIGYRWMNTHGFREALETIVYGDIPRYVKPGEGATIKGIEGYELLSSANWRTRVKVYFRVGYGGVERIVPVEFTIYFNPVKCPRCIMVESGEYEAVIQIRDVDKSLLNKILRHEFMRSDRLRRDLVDVIETSNGIDLYFYNHGAARKLARRLAARLGLRIVENYEQVGVKSGKPRARLTISLR